ncbi:ABC transporter permease [Nitrospira moscoviensis]|uniref:Putative transporter subunit: permease component of ABC superfamily n=1 Tax=Nitrospira moscoviensis TaxID=42253 RepID=A0A0K2GHZ0_NITMO|nr:ABC transporter permease [Nitrospira moscoviensis]ALA60242.1 putative transporter subunit: permease component of ABC superfamily [Nitrospira moscoviensis]
MRRHRLAAIIRKETLQISRDLPSLLITVAMPLLLMLAFGYGVRFDVKNLPVYVYDREGSQRSQDFLTRFQASEYFDVVKTVDRYPALVDALDAGACRLALVIPGDFSRQLNSGGPVSVQALIDATDNNTANVAVSYSEAVVQSYNRQIQLEWLERHGRTGLQPVLRVETRTWFNEDLESTANIVPGVVAIIMAVIGSFLTSLTIAREWERGTMEQLVSTPVTPLELMIGKLVPYFAIGLLDTVLCAALAIWWFEVPFRGAWSVFFLSCTLFLIVVLSLGYVVSVVAKTQLAASQVALIATFLPAFLLSGFIYPIGQMPAVIQAITHIIPARYFMTIIRDIFLKGTPLPLLLDDLLALALFATILTIVATRAFHKKLS